MASVFPHLQEEAEFVSLNTKNSIYTVSPACQCRVTEYSVYCSHWEIFTSQFSSETFGRIGRKSCMLSLYSSDSNILQVQPPSIHSHDSSSAEEDITITDASYKSPAKKEDPTDVKVINCFDNLPSFHIREQ